MLDSPLPDEIGKAMHEARHVSGALALIDRESERGRPFDVIHDHNEAVTVAFADRIAVPVVHTRPRAVHAGGSRPLRAKHRLHSW